MQSQELDFLSVQLPSETKRAIRIKAAERGVSVSQLMRELIDLFLQKEVGRQYANPKL